MDNSAVTNDFGYNLRSEATSAAMGTNDYSYAFDATRLRPRASARHVGNRQSASRLEAAAAVTNLYASNPLNPYTNILCAPAPLRETSPTYDLDGNTTTNGMWCYAWDGENRLIRADDGSNVVVYAYDFMSRRISRTAYRRIAENAFETLNSSAFLYDGWNILSEVVGGPGSTPAATNLYTWGLDLSGTLQGAGGIGGLLAASLNGTNVFYSFDGNGNVTDLINANGGTVAHYEYDPFGRIIASTGTLATANSFRFSTKHWDDETGLGYWGYRWYGPELGRWLSRDPIGEAGRQRNLYCITRNRPTGLVDLLGLNDLDFGVAARLAVVRELGSWHFRGSLVVSAQYDAGGANVTADVGASLYNGGIGTDALSPGKLEYDVIGTIRYTNGSGDGENIPVPLITPDFRSAFPNDFGNSWYWGGGYLYNSTTDDRTDHMMAGFRDGGFSLDYQNDQGAYPFLPLPPGTDQAWTASASAGLLLDNGDMVSFDYVQFTGVPELRFEGGRDTVYPQPKLDHSLNRGNTSLRLRKAGGFEIELTLNGPFWGLDCVHYLKDLPGYERWHDDSRLGLSCNVGILP